LDEQPRREPNVAKNSPNPNTLSTDVLGRDFTFTIGLFYWERPPDFSKVTKRRLSAKMRAV